MHRRYSPAYFLFASVVVLGLTPPMVDTDAQAQIAFTSERDGNREIYVMDADGDNQRRLTNSRLVDWDPSWSPDGRHIAFTANGRPGDWGARGGDLEIYVMDANGTNLRKFTNNLRQDTGPAWSPDGKRIAYTSTIDRNQEIYVIDTDRGQPRRLTNSGDVHIHNWNPSWSPDGERIVFVSEGDGNKEIYTINADGRRDPRRLTDNPQADTDPAWYDPAFALAVAPADKKFTIWGWLKQVNRSPHY